MLQAHGIRQLADIRKLPGSKRYPQFNQDPLKASLRACGIRYRHMKGLGGLRKATGDLTNAGWENAGFRAYADYMQTEEFEGEVERLLRWAAAAPTVLMCAEAVPWKCHRLLLSDILDWRKMAVHHILSPTQVQIHHRTPFAKVRKGRLIYPKS